MSTVRIPEGKKRYAVTLSIDTVEKYRALSKSLGMPITSMSALCEDAISQVTATMAQFAERHKTKGKLSMVDLVQVIGQQLEELEKEETKREEKEETCPDCGRPMHRFHHCELNPVANPQPKRSKRNPVSD